MRCHLCKYISSPRPTGGQILHNSFAGGGPPDPLNAKGGGDPPPSHPPPQPTMERAAMPTPLRRSAGG